MLFEYRCHLSYLGKQWVEHRRRWRPKAGAKVPMYLKGTLVTSKLALTSVQVFQFLTPIQVKRLLHYGKTVERRARDILVMAGEPVLAIYVIGEGAVGVYPPGTQEPIVRLTSGQSFGEMSFIDATKASATIRVEEEGAKLMLVLHTDLATIIADDPSFGLAFYHGMSLALSQNLRRTTAKIAEEIRAGQQLLDELTSEGNGVAFDINLLPVDLNNHNQKVLATLEEAAGLSQGLITKCPQEVLEATRLQSKIDEAKQHYLKFYPKLARQMQMIAQFIANIETSLIHAGRD